MTPTNEDAILAYMGRNEYRPLNKSELARALEVPPEERVVLRDSLKHLEARGAILKGKKGRFALPSSEQGTVIGVFRSYRGRGGELVPTDHQTHRQQLSRGARVMIPSPYVGTALDGDSIVVRLRRSEEPHWLKHLPAAQQEKMKAKRTRDSRLEGEVLRVLERPERKIVGTLSVHSAEASLRPDNEHLPKRILLPGGVPSDACDGDKAIATIDSWDSVRVNPEGHLLKVLGAPNQPGMDILSIIHKHGLPVEFTEDVLAEADAIPEVVTKPEDLAEREDWRDREVITIDPFDARDFDDAIAVTPLDEGGWELAVHIADVSHYVRPGSAIDREARLRGNSTYLVDRVLPMLPEALSNGICSLKPNEDRFTFCVLMRFDATGTRGKTRFFPAVIRSQRRLSYEQAIALMKGSEEDEPDIRRLLQCAWALASKLRQQRFKQGSLNLDFPETKVFLDEQGKPTDMRVIDYDESHQLIEEFMLAANEAVAVATLRAQQPALYRTHEDPDTNKLTQFRDVALAHGLSVGNLSHRPELQKVLKSISGRPDEHLLKLAFLKSLKRAAYSADSLGHFGLAKTHYTHFTSPIRRYTDLLVHRVLRRLLNLDSASTPNQKRLIEIADHLSRTERAAAEAETESKQLKIVEYFERLSRKSPPKQFEAVVVEIARIGLFVEILGLQTRGLIRVGDLPGDKPYRYEAARMRYVGGKKVIQLGDTLDVELARVDRQRCFIDFRAVS
jgi:ribonuclease R